MASVGDVLAAIGHVENCTGDPRAWTTGLTPDDVSEAATVFAVRPQRLEVLLAKIHQQHADLFDATTGSMIFPSTRWPGSLPSANPPSGEPPSAREEGDAAAAIRYAESALAHQESATAQVDLQVVSAILNAHLKAFEGWQALNKLQRDIETAVQTRTDLNTPAGARDFQRFLISKLNDIRAVVAGVSLDDTSKSALMAAWTSLYNSSKGDRSDSSRRGPASRVDAASLSPADGMEPPLLSDAAMDPYLDSLLASDPGLLPGDVSATGLPAPTPAVPSIPGLGWGAMPSGAAIPGSIPGGAGGFPLSALLPGNMQERSPDGLDDVPLTLEDLASKDQPSSDDSDEYNEPDVSQTDEADQSSAAPGPQAAGPTTVMLSDGETVTAASPQLAAAIKAAAGGTPIADAFRQQGISIPPPGTAVTNPVDLSRVAPGDIGMFTDRHALALGSSKALLNGQIQHISTVSGPSFLGWEHPPAPTTAPAGAETPTPTRPAVAVSTSQ